MIIEHTGCNPPAQWTVIGYNVDMINQQWISLDRGTTLSLHFREYPSKGQSAGSSFVLLHGLASNARTWDQVGVALAQKGHRVIAVDQRGHGLSDKPDEGYDFATIAADLLALLDALEIEKPILIGQSWGGNVVLAFGAAYPRRVAGLGFVDGGYIDLQMRPEGTWDAVSVELKPPPLMGLPAVTLADRLARGHPEWSQSGIDATMANFEVLDDGTVRPWLSLDRHMLILRSLWEQRPGEIYPQVRSPVYIAVAEDARNAEWTAIKRKQIVAAEAALARAKVEVYPSTDHDIHVHRPVQLAEALHREWESGIWSGPDSGKTTHT